MAVTFIMEPTRSQLRIDQSSGFIAPKPKQLDNSQGIMLSPAIARQVESLPSEILIKTAQLFAHDFRHHLGAVYANAEFLSGTKYPADKEELLGEIRLVISCMTDQLDSLLHFTKTGCIFMPRRQSLKLIIDQAVQMVRFHPETRRVKVTQQDMASLESYVDGPKLCSAIFNLLLNACQASKVVSKNKQVDVALDHDSSDVFVRVLDSGPGVSHTIRETLFQPFAKAGGAKGMGLTIARQIAQEHGGDVYLEASRPGRTVFVLKLPILHLGSQS